MIRYYLGAEPILDNVETYPLQDPDQRGWVLDHLDELVLKPVDGSGGYGLVIGPAATAAELDALRHLVEASPRAWIAQPVISLSTAPTHVGGQLAPRHLDLRPFAVNDGTRVWVAPGGLSRVALQAGSLVVNSSQGGGSKDTWVLAGAGASPREETPRDRRAAPPRAVPAPDPGPASASLGQQQQQQQC
jgi:uncharacterized circularly permuted ATP-grasp superfamily protein